MARVCQAKGWLIIRDEIKIESTERLAFEITPNELLFKLTACAC
jgi:hypothetical protein